MQNKEINCDKKDIKVIDLINIFGTNDNLARFLGVHPQTIQRWKRENIAIPKKRIIFLKDRLKEILEYL